MVDCFDRIHLQLTDTILRALRALDGQTAPAAVTVRLPGRGCRIRLTVTKQTAEEPRRDCFYTWSASAGDGSQTWTGTDWFATPDDAYWHAVDLIGSSIRPPVEV